MRLVPAIQLVLLSTIAAQAKDVDIEAKSAIEAVTVHPDAATVTRRATLDVPAGPSTILFKNLPFSLDPASLRVAGEARGHLSIGAVEARVAPADARAPDTAIEARLKQLRADRDAIQVTIDALSAKQEMIVRYSQAGPEKLSPESRPLAVAEWNAAFDAVGAALVKTGDELRAANAKAKDIDEEIFALEAGKGRSAANGPAREVAVAIEAETAGKIALTLTYLVGDAGWRPAYDARLDTGGKERKPQLELVRRASVTQRSGEDWTDAALAVSTTRAKRGAAAPEVQPQRVSFWEPPVPLATRAAPQSERADGVRKRSMEAAALAPAPEAQKPEPAEQQVASLDANAFQASFKIAGLNSVPSNGASKSFVLSSRRIEPTLTVRISPALDATAYLDARIVNEEDAPLLPGVVSVQRDGVFVGQTRIGLIAPGEASEFGFGADDKVKVTRAPVKRIENEPSWFGQSKFETRDFKTSVKNLHDFAIHATVIDRIPFSESTAITVETLPQTTPPSEKQVGDKRGVMSWSFDAQPGETKEIRLAYRVKWPADREIVMQEAPTPR
jgi:uncharacterized protein (TIGR02231 family)